jgi:DNA-binding NarL/FixJ family response regulator
MLKDEAPESLAQAVRVIEQGAVWFSHVVASRMMALKHPSKVLFTPREELIFSLLLQGHDNQEIADRLCLARQTIRNLISNIYQKTGVKNRIQASVWAKDNLWESSPWEIERTHLTQPAESQG